MVYRFDEEWNGDVIAEAREQGMEAYLGLKFPASDIPKQARELYKKTPYRLIPTTEYEALAELFLLELLQEQHAGWRHPLRKDDQSVLKRPIVPPVDERCCLHFRLPVGFENYFCLLQAKHHVAV